MTWHYSNTAVETTLSSGINNSVTSLTIGSTSGLPVTFPFTVIVDYGGAAMEVMTVTGLAGSTLTVTRGQDGTSAQSHNAGAVVVHGLVARDAQEPQDHIAATGNVHGVGASAAIVGTSTAQTLTNKTISGASNTLSNIAANTLTGNFGPIVAVTSGAAVVPLTAKAAAAQTADRFRAEDNAGASPTKINAAGQLVTESIQPTGTLAIGNNVNITGTATASGAVTSGGVLTSTGLLDANAGADISGGNIVLNAGANNVTATAGTFGVTGTHAITGNATVSGTLTVAGTDVGDKLTRLTPLFVRKTGSTSRTSTTTLADDPDLQLAVLANAVYEFHGNYRYDGDAAGDIKLAHVGPASATLSYHNIGQTVGAAAVTDIATSSALNITTAYSWGCRGAAAEFILDFHGLLVVAGTAGTFKVQFAQNTSNGVATRLLADSFMRLTRVA